MNELSIIIILSLIGCGIKTAPIAKTIDLRPDIPYKTKPAAPPLKTDDQKKSSGENHGK